MIIPRYERGLNSCLAEAVGRVGVEGVIYTSIRMGTMQLPDGRQAQIQLTLTTDSDEFLEPTGLVDVRAARRHTEEWRGIEKKTHTCVINDAGNCYTCGERAPYFRVIEPPVGHNSAVASLEASRRAKAQILPPPVPEGATVNDEIDIIRVWGLPDEHCQECHNPARLSSVVAVGQRIIKVCCTVTHNFKEATGQAQ